MKIYEYARKRNIKSKDVVKRLHELGFNHLKNHLSLVPGKVIDKLDKTPFPVRDKALQSIVYLALECQPFINDKIGDKVSAKLTKSKRVKNTIILPKFNITDTILEKVAEDIYKTTYKLNDYYFLASPDFERPKLLGYADDHKRIAFYMKKALKVIEQLEVDIINIHDWPLGLFPLFYRQYSKLNNAKIEFSIYDPTYSGIYALNDYTDVFKLDNSTIDLATYAKSINLLKAGLVTADTFDISKTVIAELKQSYLKAFIYDNMRKS